MNMESIFLSDIASENVWKDRLGRMENSFTKSGIRITKTTFDPRTENGILPRDVYYGIHCGPIYEMDEENAIISSLLCAEKLNDLLKPLLERSSKFTALFVGIGNKDAEADALGPLTAEKVFPSLIEDKYLPKLNVIAPGVYAHSGIETASHTAAIAKAVSADVIIAVDSLSAGCRENLASYIQIGNCGITPGSGTAKRGKGITYSTVGIPVMAIGIPTVISSSLLFESENRGKNREVTTPPLCVSPLNCNIVTEVGASILARAINTIFQKGI